MSLIEDAVRNKRADNLPPALAVKDLEMAYLVRGEPRAVLRGVTFEVRPGEALSLIHI